MSVSTMQTTRKISFVHEAVETFRAQNERPRKKSLTAHGQQAFQGKEPPPKPLALLSPQYQFQKQRNGTTPSPTIQHLASLQLPRVTTATEGVITLFLSMEMCCARVSEEVITLWGYDPTDLIHRSLYGLISSHDTDRLGRLHRLLLDNIMHMACQHDPSFRADMRPPPSERTTSPLFYETDPGQLCLAANGSSTFKDTLHIKKKSGEYDLYEVLVYLGSGFGADLTRTSTLDRLYVVAELKKHLYEVKPSSTEKANDNQQKHRSTLRSQPSDNNINKPSLLRNRTHRPLAPQFSRYGTNSSNHSNLLQVRQGSLPVHFSNNYRLNTVSLPVARKSDVPKVNVAPMTGQAERKDITDRLFPSVANGPQFCRITTAANSTTTPPMHVNPYSSIAYKFAPVLAGSIGSPRRTAPSITHPTTQYFLQTSSSTLNVAASAAQRNMQHNSSMTENVAKTDSTRKAEMSVRSLLC
ncbi:hypothetical protein BX666DRAFT_226792 [Dichotomocladium elegans]|nr:hypothetical protein BX666DRAFT_226792 [Dichotomocladium elegans]